METNISTHQSQLQQAATGQEVEPKGIVLNRMYTGSYLSTNLGHEVINMFQADDGNHYLYLNSKGNFTKRGANVGTMLLVRGIGDKRVEIVGLAKKLIPIKSAQCTLPRDLGRINRKVQREQLDYIEGITYGGVRIKDIFGDKGQQSVYVSYKTNHESFYRPKRRIIINFGSEKKIDNNSEKKTDNNGDIEIFLSLNFASTSLHQYVSEDLNNDDWNKLQERCGYSFHSDEVDEDLWMRDNTQAIVPEGFYEHQESLFDICRIQDDENRFSNALSYFIEKYPDIWIKFFESKGVKLSKIDSVTREEDAKIDNSKCNEITGGRIDLLIRTPECYIIIENKIDSRIIFQGGVSQIQRYYNYVNYLQREEQERLDKAERDLKTKKDGLFAERDKYDGWIKDTKKLNHKLWGTWLDKFNNLTTDINKTEKDLKDLPVFNERKVVGFVLAPNYNPPTDDELDVKDSDGFKFISYQELYYWLQNNAKETIDEDPNFKAFHNAMKKHTYATKSEAIREDMMNIFFTRIQKCHTKSSNLDQNA